MDPDRNISSPNPNPNPNCLCLGGEKTKIYTPNPRKYLHRNFLVKCSSSLRNKVRSFVRKREPKITPDWSGVVLDLLLLTLQRLPVPDVLRCEAICTAWAAAVRCLRSSRLPLPRQTPWLFMDIRNSDGSRTFPISNAALEFYSLFEPRKFYTVHLRMDPPISQCSCIAAKDGWLILVEAAGRLNILNPITGARIIDIPHLSTIDPQYSVGRFAVKAAALSGSPSDGNWVITAIFVHVPGLFYVRAGDRQWTKCKSTIGHNPLYGKVIYSEGLLSVNGEIWDFFKVSTSFTFECQIDHATVVRSSFGMFKVYKNRQESEVTSIGNYAILAGDNGAICISFAEKIVEIDRSIVTARPPFPTSSISYPTWLTPSLN